jgi:hypothetical protein
MILLSLAGEQPIPNLIPLWHSPDRYTATQFAVTDRTKDVAETTRQAIADDEVLRHLEVLEPLLVRPYNIGETRRILANAINGHLENGQDVCLNLTGGTKIMSLAMLQAAYGMGVPLLYVATERNLLIHYQSDGSETQREDLRVSITVKQYLSAHGIECSPNANFKAVRYNDAIPAKAGDLLEEQVYQAAKASGAFDDVQRNLYIRRRGQRATVQNELDVVVTHNGRMAICSCKSGKDPEKGALYELESLSRRELTGIYCGKVFVSAQPDLPDSFKDRARADRVRIVFGDKLNEIAEILKQVTER